MGSYSFLHYQAEARSVCLSSDPAPWSVVLSNEETNSATKPPNEKQRPNRRWLRWVIEAAIFIVALTLIYAYQTRHLISDDGYATPQLTGNLINGGTFDLRELTGDRTLVYFFAPWCAYCSASMDNLNRLRRWKDVDELNVVLVAIDWESSAQILAYAEKHNLQVPVMLAEFSDAEAWHVQAFPTYYVLDGQHRIIASDLGYSTMLGLWLRT